jgi:uncharacterized repeat protein (TIGR01451 family)
VRTKTFAILAACFAAPTAGAVLLPDPHTSDVAITYHTANPSPAFVGKDIVYDLRITNNGPDSARNVITSQTVPSGATFIWASPGCNFSSGTVYCGPTEQAVGQTFTYYMVVRPTSAGSASTTANVTINLGDTDPNYTNNTSTISTTVTTLAAGVPIVRYRLYSPVTKEHHFTTDLNEYNTLGSYTGTWTQEGTVGKVLNNPGSFGGVTAVPYYRLYNGSTQWHHWTTDPNEYYTLAGAPGWYAEGVDGYILPAAAPTGTTQLYRLNYPPLGSLHHWTIDANEYNTLITSYGWVGEGGSGFVVQ